MTNKFLLLSFFCCTMMACRDAGPNDPRPAAPQPERGVFIINEGSFPNAGSISFYNIDSNTVTPNAIGTSAGWIVPNDARVIGKKLYVVVNGADKIFVRNADTFQAMDSIAFPPRTGPGYLWTADSTRAYVANYNGTVSIVNVVTNTVIQTSGSVVTFPGGITVTAGRIYVSDYGLYPNYRNIVTVLDASSLTVVATVEVGLAAGSMTNGGGRVYVVCAGSFPSRGKVYAVDVARNVVADSLTVGDGPSDIAMREQNLYVLHGTRVMRLTANPLGLRDSSFIRLGSGEYYYAMQVAEVSGDVFISKIVSVGGAGEVEIYSASGALKRSPFPVGIFPGAFAFKQ